MGEWGTAADYWRKARNIALNRAKPPVSDWALYYDYREADAYVKEGLYEFSYDRAKTAIFLIETGELPESLEGENYHQKLRAIRMMSAFHYFKGNQAWEKMKVDAEWIEENASDEKIINLAKSLLALSGNLPRMQEIISKEITPEMRAELEKLAKEVRSMS